MQSAVSGSSGGDRSLSLVSMGFPAARGELSCTEVTEAQVSEAEVGGPKCAERLQRPGGEKNNRRVRKLLPLSSDISTFR